MARNRHGQKSGQILILMSLFITTLIILFGMVVAVGHLVQSKINLQNSVDLAAMSGASWQARYLNGFSEINYRMRQNHRYFLLDTYVTQARFNRAWQEEVFSGKENVNLNYAITVFAICQQSFEYVPSPQIGEPGSGIGATDMCRNVTLSSGLGEIANRIPPIVPSPFPSLNPFYIAINLAIIRLADRFNEVCTESAQQNEAWITYATEQFYNKQNFQMSQMRRVGENFSSSFGYIQPGVEIRSGPVADSTVLSTYVYNLIGSNREGSPRLFYLNNHESRATTNGIDGYLLEATTPVNVTYIEFENSGGCGIKPMLFTTGSNIIPVGMTMRRTAGNNDIQPFFTILGAVAEPNILFWPDGYRPTIAAVAAAKPFGSRVGPPLLYYQDEITRVGNADMANMSFFPGDVAANTGGFPGMGNTRLLLEALRRMPGGINSYQCCGNPAFRPTGNDAFWQLAYAPTVYDSVFLNAYVDEGGTPNIFRPTQSAYIMQGVRPDDSSYLQNDSRRDRQPAHEQIPSTVGLSSGGVDLYRPNLTASSWAPPGESGRHGYQIKLVSLQQACLETQASGQALSGLLQELCYNMGVDH